MDNLEERVKQFEMMRLPGQPRSMHMGTSYLINDLWREVKKLRGALDGLRESKEVTTLDKSLAESFERLRAFVRKRSPGQCKMLSAGFDCECPLCDLNRLENAIKEVDNE